MHRTSKMTALCLNTAELEKKCIEKYRTSLEESAAQFESKARVLEQERESTISKIKSLEKENEELKHLFLLQKTSQTPSQRSFDDGNIEDEEDSPSIGSAIGII